MHTGCLSTWWSLVTTATFSSSQQSRSKSLLLKDWSPWFPTDGEGSNDGHAG